MRRPLLTHFSKASAQCLFGKSILLSSMFHISASFFKASLLAFIIATPAAAQPKPVAKPPAVAQPAPPEPPAVYEPHMLRLADILGAMHRLDEVCLTERAGELRQMMQALIDAEGASAERKLRLTNTFNQSYRSFSDSYQRCTDAAKLLHERYREEALKMIAEMKARFSN